MGKRGDTTFKSAFVNWLVIAVSVLAAAVLHLSGCFSFADIKDSLGVLPASLRPLSLFTGSLLYPDVFLLAVCMFYLWMVGGSIEKRTGHIFYLVLYFGGFACGALAHAAAGRSPDAPVIGAAGAIAAMLGAHVARLPEVRTSAKTRVPSSNSLWLVLIWAMFQLLYGMDYQPASVFGASLSINLGGFTFGVLAAAVALRFTRAVEPAIAPAQETVAKPTPPDTATYEELPKIDAPGAEDEVGERFAIFRCSPGPLDISEIGRMIAGMLKIPLADVTTRLHACSGFLAESLSKKQAQALKLKLEETNIPVFVVEQKKVRDLPEAELALDAAFDAEGLRIKISDRVETLPWNSILMANAGVIESWRMKEVAEDPDDDGKRRTALGFGPKRKQTKLVKEVQRRLVLDVLLREPWRRIRLQEEYTTFNLMADGRKPTSAGNLAAVAQELAGRSGDFLVGDGAVLVGAGSALEEFAYDNRRKYDLVNFWLAHRALYNASAN